jgi:hypothetical protein
LVVRRIVCCLVVTFHMFICFFDWISISVRRVIVVITGIDERFVNLIALLCASRRISCNGACRGQPIIFNISGHILQNRCLTRSASVS